MDGWWVGGIRVLIIRERCRELFINVCCVLGGMCFVLQNDMCVLFVMLGCL